MLVSACLLGVRCRYDGTEKACPDLLELFGRLWLVPVCPEQLGGLPTPRPSAVLREGDGRDVLQGRGRVVNEPGDDVTGAFVRGAHEALRLARLCLVRLVVLKDLSPSCGLRTPYCDRAGGGMGVTAALLAAEGFQIVEAAPERDLPAALMDLARGVRPA